MATHGSSSEHDGDDSDDEDSSSDEEVESMVAMYVKKIFKYVKKVNMYGHNVVRERRPKQTETIAVREWTSGGELSYSSLSDESRKNFITRFMQGPSSSLLMCLMAKGMESNVSDDESDTTSIDDLVVLSMSKKECLTNKLMKLKNSMLSMILVQPLLQIMNICCANLSCLARSVMI
jgi:hypothetical protein